jgi:hypothetical protein
MSIRRSVLVVVAGILVAMLSPLAANAQEPAPGVTCNLPESDVEALVILNNYRERARVRVRLGAGGQRPVPARRGSLRL